jgi:sugar lactone lactonase YvrE
MRQPADLRTLGDARAVLGEGMRYDAESDSLSWLDIPASRGWSVTPDGVETRLNLGPEAGFACREQGGTYLAGGANGLTRDGASICGGADWLGDAEVLNDGAVHPSGGFLVCGSRDRDEARPSGHMWLLGQSFVRLPWAFTVFNGPAFSPDGQRIYFADSPVRTIYAAPVDSTAQTIGARAVFAVVPDDLGYPDGMACDDDGGLWSAHWDGGCLTRYQPDGSVDYRVALPVRRPTSLAFRGNMIAVTSAQPDGPPTATLDGRALLFRADRIGPASPRLSAAILDTFAKDIPHAS